MEPGHELIAAALARASRVATAIILYPEARSALARHAVAGQLGRAQLESARRDLDALWAGITAIVPVDEGRVRMAGDIAERHRIRGMDAIHLGAALELARRSAPEPLSFASWDTRQRDAARREGLALFPEDL